MKFCKKCQVNTERRASGRCAPCSKKYNAAYRAANKEKVKAYQSAYHVANKDVVHAHRSAYRAANKEKEKASRAAYYASNTEKVKASSYAWSAANPGKRKVYQAVYRAANPEKAKASTAAYRAANRDKIRVRDAVYRSENRDKSAEYRKANLDACRSNGRNRRARKRNAEGRHTAADIRNLMILQKSKCACCKTSIKDGYHVDHIHSLANGGSNDKLNLQLLCASCNMSKSARHPIDFMQSRGFLL